jgi:Zn-dependent peptidase ImmA (M78 family)
MEARKFLRKNKLSIPFKIKKAIKILSITLYSDKKFEKLPAMTTTNDQGQKLIVVNNNISKTQQRFSICHEIAHIILGHQGSFHFLTSSKKNKSLNEKCADAFASELLVPSHKLTKIAYQHNFDIKKLKKIFKVSEYAMVVKMKIVGLPIKNTFYKNRQKNLSV